MQKFIDLRSDTVTKPTPEMQSVMASAEVGDDVFGEDPTVNKLQEKVAEILGKEKALFVPSGTMGNQICINANTEPADEIIVEYNSHIFNYEGGAPGFLSRVQVHPLQGERGVIKAEQIKNVIRPFDHHFARTKLICVENTHNRAGGTIFPIDEIKRIKELANENKLRMHLDGARLWNASVATGISPKEYAKYFNSVSVCFSKGLGAPVGSCVAGSAEFIDKAHRYRKIYGGGMRQSGILASAALYALENNIERLEIDHENAKLLANGLSKISEIEIDIESVQTNIVIIDIKKSKFCRGLINQTLTPISACVSALKEKGILVVGFGASKMRAVTHLDVSKEEILQAIEVFENVMENR